MGHTAPPNWYSVIVQLNTKVRPQMKSHDTKSFNKFNFYDYFVHIALTLKQGFLGLSSLSTIVLVGEYFEVVSDNIYYLCNSVNSKLLIA